MSDHETTDRISPAEDHDDGENAASEHEAEDQGDVLSARNFRVVGLGASAGGIEALQAFFKNLPPGSGLSFVVLLHMAPERKSLLPEILERWTGLHVEVAQAGQRLEPEHIYVIPPGRVATVHGMRLALRAVAEGERRQSSIDIFFDSLAADLGKKAIGIVLSGTGHDGALGLKAIRDAGGMTIAQGSDGTVPKYAGMPDSAIATGAVDLILAVEAMPATLMAAQHPALLPPPAMIADARLRICRILHDRLGHDFSQYKENTFLRRVHRRMQLLNIQSLEKYTERLGEDRDESVLLFRDLLIGVTSFFRDAETFGVLERDILPKLFAGKTERDALRVWVAGCATGEEAYSIAILLRQHAATLDAPPEIQVFATDIDEMAIAAARAGRYPATLLNGMPPELVARFFTPTEGGYAVAKEIRDICTFSPHSLIRDPPFSRVDLVSCRNLLIYMDNELQARVIPIFHYALTQGGVLLLGSSETVSRFENLFGTLDKTHRIFERHDVPSPLPQLAYRTLSMARDGRRPDKPEKTDETNEPHAVARGCTRVLEHYAPAFVVVLGNGDILHYSHRTGRYFEPAAGPPSRNLFDMARPDYRLALRSALRRAAATGERVEQVVAGGSGAGEAALSLIVEPIAGETVGESYLVLFAEPRQIPEPSDANREPRHEDLQITTILERENPDLREQLQSVKEAHETALEELRSSNEELHSLNEELQSSNEELETSREEIQSINEEMSTINVQLSAKVEELDRANSDLKNLFESTKVATIFLDRHLVIRAYTPEVAGIYNLIPSDIGRPLADIVNRLDYTTLRSDAAQVLAILEPMERRVIRDDGSQHYLMRLLPYRSPDSSVDGLLITFIEVTSIVQAEQHQRMLVDELNHRVKNMLTVVIALASQTLRRAANLSEFSDAFLGRLHALTKAYELLSLRSWEDVPLTEILADELHPFLNQDLPNITLDGLPVALDARSALAIGMAIHELSTNAAKHGALSVPDGKVTLHWTVERTEAAEMFTLDWIERDGPQVRPPARRGFGLTLIERGLAHELNGHAEVRFLPDGVQARLRAPIRKLKQTQIAASEEAVR
jgi:two-component system CheB/CheR fusion protein